MNTTSPTLDQAPPDWASYARTMQEHADEHNRWKRKSTKPSGQQRAETAVLEERGTPGFEAWLRGGDCAE